MKICRHPVAVRAVSGGSLTSFRWSITKGGVFASSELLSQKEKAKNGYEAEHYICISATAVSSY